MSFMSRFKKKPAPNKPPPQPTSPQLEPVTSPKKEELPELPSPTHAVEISDSIFTGLKLSARVASNEDDGSPYIQRAAEPQGESSSFSFMKGSSQPADSPELSKSPFQFISDEPQDEDTPSFSFLHDAGAQNVEEMSPTLDSVSSSNDPISSHVPITYNPASTHDSVSSPSDSVSKSLDPLSPHRASPAHSPSGKALRPPAKVVKKKKKLKKAVQPGQAGRMDDADSLSLSSHASSLDRSDGIPPLSPEHSAQNNSLGLLVSIEDPPINEDHIQNNDPPFNQEMALNRDPLSIDTINSSNPPSEDPILSPTSEQKEEVPVESNTSSVSLIKDLTVSDTASNEDEKSPSEESTVNNELSTEAITDSPSQNPSVSTEDAANENQTKSEDLTKSYEHKSNQTPPPVSSANYSLELSESDKLTVLLESLESGLTSIRKSSSLEGLRSTVDEAISGAQAQVEKRNTVAELRGQQNRALAEEDYESAEQINQKLEDTKLIQEHQIANTALKAICVWVVKCVEMDKEEAELRTNTQARISELHSEQAQALEELDRENSSLIAKDNMKIQGMENALEREEGHILLDREHLDKREQALNAELQRRASEFLSRKEALAVELTGVQGEIEELEEKLAALKAQREKILGEIADQEAGTGGVEDELAAERSHLAQEREAIATKQHTLQQDKEKLSQERDSLAASHNVLQSSRESLANLVSRANGLIEEFNVVTRSLESSQEESQQLLGLAEEGRSLLKPSQNLEQLLESVSRQSAAVEAASSTLLSTQTKLNTERKELAQLQAQAPLLLDTKKAAVTGRQFKEASRIAGQIKELSSQESELKVAIATTEGQLGEQSSLLGQLSDELEALRGQAEAHEKQEDSEHLRELQARLARLQEVGGGLESPSLQEVVTLWSSLYSLLADNLTAKHSGELLTQQYEPDPLDEERTPGVGQEEIANSAEIEEIERQIQEACQVEDYDTAADLEEKLKSLKSSS